MGSKKEATKTEFDSYAERYKNELDHPLRNIIGRGDDVFLKIKAEWLLRHLRHHPLDHLSSPDDITLLDYGCGTGGFMKILQDMHFPGKITGCDISGKMLEEAAKQLRSEKLAGLYQIHGQYTDFAADSFDIIVAVCVFHHIPLEERVTVLREIHRILKPKGRFLLVEHNPYNPLTRFIVRQTSLDRNAVLLSMNNVARLVKTAGLTQLQSAYFLFFPPRIMFLRSLEHLLAWLPLGGQFVVVAEKR